MQRVLILAAFCCIVAAAPEGYNYKESNAVALSAPAPAPVVEHGNLNGFTPISPEMLRYLCSHASHYAAGVDRDAIGAAASLIQTQSNGRIVNNGGVHAQEQHGGLEAAASGIHSHSQAVTLNSQIVVGEGAGATQEYHPGQGYTNGPIAHGGPPVQQLPPVSQQPIQFNPGLQSGPHGPAQSFNQGAFLPSAPLISNGPGPGYVYQQGSAAAQASQHVHHHHHHTVPAGVGGIVNGVGKVPPPPLLTPPPPAGLSGGYQYAAGYTNNRYSGANSGVHTSFTAPGRGPAPSFHGPPPPYRPLGPPPPLPGPIGNFGGPRPVQHFGGSQQHGGAGSYQQASNTYAGSFSHNTHGAFSQSQSQAHGQFATQAANLFSEDLSGNSEILKGQLGNVIRETFANAPLDPTVEKHIYVHVPPEDLEEHGSANLAQALPQAPPKKHYKIIFIKAPSVSTPNYAQLAAAAAPQTEEKTLVYVLVKKPDEPSIEELQKLQQTSFKSHKPEVYFIKYKTRKEGELGAGAAPGPVFAGTSGAGTHYSSQSQFGGGLSSGSLVVPSEGYSINGDDVDAGNGIDIRLSGNGISINGGESSSISTSSSYATSSTSSSSSSSSLSASAGSIDNAPKQHELYGVPLE